MLFKVTQSHLREPARPILCGSQRWPHSSTKPWATPRASPHFPAYKMRAPISESLEGRGLWTVLAKLPFMWKMAENMIINWRSQLNCNRIYSKLLHQLHLNWPKAHEQRELDLKHSHPMHYACSFFVFFFSFFFFFGFVILASKMEAVFEKL